jgi:hypothetical protein
VTKNQAVKTALQLSAERGRPFIVFLSNDSAQSKPRHLRYVAAYLWGDRHRAALRAGAREFSAIFPTSDFGMWLAHDKGAALWASIAR